MTMNIEEKYRAMEPARQKRIEALAAEYMAQELNLREMRRARKLTQARMAKKLGISQDGVSRLEKRSDLLLSTLRKTVEAMGGTLSLVVEFPDRGRVVLTSFGAEEAGERPRKKRRVPAEKK